MTAEDLLTRSLREVTERTDHPSTPLETVAARARTLRARRRRTATLAAAVAVAAVAVPGAVWLNHSPTPSPGPSHEPSSSSTQSSSPLVHMESLSMGRAPGIAYAEDDTFVDVSGGHTRSGAVRKAKSLTPVRGGLLVALPSGLPDDRIGTLELLTDRDQGLGCGANRFAVSADGVESAYWVMDSCTAGSAGRLYSGANNTMSEGGPSFVATPAGRVVQPIGFVSQGVVANLGTPDYGEDQGVWVYGPQGGPTRVRGLATAGGADQEDDLVSGQLATDPSTGIIVHASTGVPVSYMPSWILGQFSPDGKYVLGYAPGDGIGTDQYAVLDVATGRLVTELDYRGFAWNLLQPSWDTDASVLAVAQDQDSRRDAVVRFDLQGHATLATEPTRDADTSFPIYRLAARP